MHLQLFILTLQLWICFICADSTVEPLHNYMTEPEMGYYFGSTRPNILPDYEVIYLPVLLPKEQRFFSEPITKTEALQDDSVDYSITAFGRQMSLKLIPNRVLIAPNFKVFRRDAIGEFPVTEPIEECHYLHRDADIVAAVSSCQERSINGLIFLGNSTLEIRPLTHRLQSLLKFREPLEEYDNGVDKVPHIIKRATPESSIPSSVWNEPDGGIFDVERHPYEILHSAVEDRIENNKRAGVGQKVTVEIALFFDEAAYKLFSPYMGHNDKHMRDMLLAYMNGVQALYHHPSLGTSVDLVMVRMDLMRSQPADLPHYNGERGQLLDSFCDYQKRINPPGDSNPDHWDMALYVSGLDFYAIENGRKSGITMGLATVGGVCLDKYACVIAELGTTNVFGKPYPSAGFTSVYILAHEIGHNLGMHHDSSGNNCPKDGYIMSPSRGTNGETLWSSCSASIMKKISWATCLFDVPKKPSKDLDHTRYLNTPGQIYGAKKQCEILLRDRDATVLPSQDLKTICYNLQCKTPHRSGYYFAGPALEGTTCGYRKWCLGGDCVKTTKPKPVNQSPGGWSAWKEDACKSGCIEKSQGFQTKHRTCDNPSPVNSEQGCEGSSFDVEFCKDSKICNKNKRKPVTSYATGKCRQFAKRLPDLDPQGAGLQAPHESARPWMGCAIFCRRKDSGSYYTPRVELNDMGISPYFPDGTWCHNDAGGNYYCLQHHCLPENFKFTKTSIFEGMGEDIPLSQNAHPHDEPVPPSLLSYLSLGADGKPLQTTLRPGQTKPPKEEDWEIHDYLDLPSDSQNGIIPEIKASVNYYA